MKKQKICICGGGNLGLVCAGVFAANGYSVSVLTGHPENWQQTIAIEAPDGKLYSGHLTRVGCAAEDVVAGCDVVLLCLPGTVIEQTLVKIKACLSPSAIVGTVVSSTGFFEFAHKIMPNQPLFGFQRVPFISRITEYGKTARLLGYKSMLHVAMENISDKDSVRHMLEDMFMTPVSVLETFYEAALTNSNPILHTGRLFSMWGKEKVMPLKERSLFYADWTDDASRVILSMDAEFMELLQRLNVRNGAIPSLLDYYESTDAESLTRKLKGIEAFKTIASPMVLTPDGWMPDYTSRYFTEDFPFGLRFIKELAEKNNVDIPVIS